MRDLCEIFRRQAGAVWNRMDKAAGLGMSLNEETITEITSFEMAHAVLGISGFQVRLATKPEEVLHGADWEWWLVRDGIGVGYRVQAKRLFNTGRYKHLFKSPNRLSQANTLISAANSDGMVPLYCLFNLPGPTKSHWLPTRDCAHSYRGLSRWGCALMDANHLVKWPSNKFSDLLDYSRPWHELVCVGGRSDTLPSAAARFSNFLRRLPGPDGAVLDLPSVEPRRVPDRIARMLESDLRGRARDGTAAYLSDDEVVEVDSRWVPNDVAGVVVLEDVRDEE